MSPRGPVGPSTVPATAGKVGAGVAVAVGALVGAEVTGVTGSVVTAVVGWVVDAVVAGDAGTVEVVAGAGVVEAGVAVASGRQRPMSTRSSPLWSQNPEQH